MYCKRVVSERLGKAAAKVGFEPEYHSIAEVAQANKHFNSLVHPETGILLRNLKPDEKRWVQNEILICTCDFRYYADHYAFIFDWQDRLVRFRPNIAQNISMDVWGESEEEGRAISEMALKARQLGKTTITEIAIAHRVQFYHNVNAVVASSDPDKSKEMQKKMEVAWNNMPWFLMPTRTAGRQGEWIEFGKQNSGVSIQHGTQFSGIARGTTPTVAHLSEICDFSDPKELIDASLLRAMHESPWMFLVLESTAMGRKNWWHDQWLASVEGWHLGRERLRPVFLPWFIGSDLYPSETWIRSRIDALASYLPADLTVHHAERAREYVRRSPSLTKYLGSAWQMSKEQMFFWEVERERYAKKKELAQFYSEMPADDKEAFQNTNISVFDVEVISEYRENTKSPIGVFGFVGTENMIPSRMQAARSQIDTNIGPPLPVTEWCQLVPLKFQGYSGFDWTGKLFIYEMPEEDNEYGVGIDTSEGIGKDRTVMEVMRKGTMERNDAQVAEFASPYVNAFDLAPLAYALGRLYSVRYGMQPMRQAKMVIECKGNGEATQLELRKMGWSNFHQWVRYDSKRIRQNTASKLGWFTVSWSRSMMLDYLIKAVRDDALDINSPYFVDEMADLERDEFKQSLGATYGGFDDRIMAAGFVFFSLHILEIRGNQPILSRQRQAQEETGGFYPVYNPVQAHALPANSPLRSYVRTYMPLVRGGPIWTPGRDYSKDIEK